MDDYIGLRARAALHRQQYEQDAMQRAKDAEDKGYYNLSMGFPTQMARQNLGMERAQAEYNAPWDAWYQALDESNGGETPRLGGQLGNQGQTALNTLRRVRS